MNYQEKMKRCFEISQEVRDFILERFDYIEDILDQYTFHIDDSNKRRGRHSAKNAALGYCDYVNKEIVIDTKHLIHDNMDSIEDTIRHEYAHMVAYELYGHARHGRVWRKCAVLLGAKPRATTKVENSYREESKMKAKWWMVFVPDTSKPHEFEYVTYFNRKTKNIKLKYLKGRKNETFGKLWLLDAQAYLAKKKIKLVQ